MRKNKPRTIADLKFDWEISRGAHKDINEAQKKILEKNPHLMGLKIIPNDYSFLMNESELKFTKLDITFCFDRVLSLFEYLCFAISFSYSIT